MKAAHHATVSHQGDTTMVLPRHYFWHSLSTILFALIRERGRSHMIHPTGNGTKLSTNSQHTAHITHSAFMHTQHTTHTSHLSLPLTVTHTPQSISSDFLLYCILLRSQLNASFLHFDFLETYLTEVDSFT